MPQPLTNLWERVRTQLEEARAQLSSPSDESLTTYLDFLRHNELGLALDALADVARDQRSSIGAWRSLGEAAAAMGLDPDDGVHGGTVQEILKQLSAADSWPGSSRRDE